MTMVGKTLVGLTVASLLVAGPAFAGSDVDKELAEMRELVEGLKQKVDAQEEQIEHQGGLLEDAQKVVREQQKEEAAKSALAEYWEAVDVSLSMAASYAWNFANPDLDNTGGAFPGVGANQGTSGLFYPFHGDHNSFQVDQVLFNIAKDPTEESRSGFGFTILYGNTAAFLGQGGNLGGALVTVPSGTVIPGVGTTTGDFSVAAPQSRRSFGDSTSDYYVHEAYISFLAPVVDVEFTAGKFATLIGAEVADTAQNFNITMGNIYNLFQPIDHVGILGSREFGPISFTAGVVNQGNLSISSPDVNKEKGYIGQVGFAEGAFGSALTVLYTADGSVGLPGSIDPVSVGNDGKKYGIVDGVISYAGDGFEAWLNGDYTWVEGSRPSAWGLAIAGRVPLTEVFSAALRLEYARDQGDFFGILGTRNSSIYSATGTLAYELAENLTLRGEVRWDRVVESSNFIDPDTGLPVDNEFFTRTSNGNNNQVVGLAQVVYSF